jgi:hypothetical protein
MIVSAFVVIFALSWLGGILVNRGLEIGADEDKPMIPGPHRSHTDNDWDA